MDRQQQQMPGGGGWDQYPTRGAVGTGSSSNPFTLGDELDLLGPDPFVATQQQQQQRQQQQQQQQQQQIPAIGDLLDLNSSSSSTILPGPLQPSLSPTSPAAAAAAAAAARPSHLQPPSQPAAAAAAAPHVLSLRNSIVQQQQPHRTASLGYGDLIVLDDDTDHPIETPAGGDATLMLAGQVPAVGSAAAGGSGSRVAGARSARGARQEVVGVHGGDEHVPEDEQTRTVQIQTLGGEGVLTPFQRFLKAAGVRRRRPRGAFASNELITSKYNVLSFIPVNLYHQFKRVANLYFLALICLQAIPGLSPVPWWGTLFPLAVVLAVNGVKEAFDDYWRHKSDEQVNHRFVTTLKEDGDQRIHWKALQVGDLVRLSNNEDIPADIVLLASSDPEGLCYVETANLDGETNLKVKFCHNATASFDCAEAFSRAGYFTLECEAPNPRLYSFEGAICCWDFPPTYDPHGTMGLSVQSSRAMHPRAAAAATAAAAAAGAELELAAAAAAEGTGSGWYSSASADQQQQQQRGGSPSRQQQQQQRSRSPARGGSPTRQRRQQQQSDLGGDGLTASLGEYGQQVGLVYREPLSASNLLLRGSTLRKTEWVIGAVVFTGPDTKVVRNMLPSPRKVTRLELAMNRVVVVVLVTLGGVAVFLGIANMAWESRHNPSRDWYLGEQTGWPELSPGVGSLLVQIIRFIILMAQAVPISLYVSLETVKVAQCKLLYDRDRAMYYAPEDVPCTSRTTTLNEELGQVQYVLSDKTGTLTQNIMGFVWASIGGNLYGQAAQQQQQQQQAQKALTAAAAAAAGGGGANGNASHGSSTVANAAKQTPAAAAAAAAGSSAKGSGGGVVIGAAGELPPVNTPHTIALDAEMRAAATAAAAGDGSGSSSMQVTGVEGAAAAAAVGEFLLALALCNTVVPTATDQGQLLYQAASPDEEALVAGAAYLGTKLVARSAAGIEVEVGGHLRRVELLAVLEFSSDRKRMSVVVRHSDGQVQLITKGADNVMLERLAGVGKPAAEQAALQPLLASTSAHLSDMSKAGYRTLVVASRALQQQDYDAWAARYKDACASLVDRNGRVAAVCEEMEKDLTLLGATAVEDKLQDGVPESIAALSAAGIKVWVLTGDKMETAVSIGHTARLLHQQMAVIKVLEADLITNSSSSGSSSSSTTHRQQQQQQPGTAPVQPSLHGLASSPVISALKQMRLAAAAVKAGQTPGQRNGQTLLTGSQTAGLHPRWLQMPATAAAAAGAALVIDGAALALALQPQHENELLFLCKECSAVICCRVSPMQKAQIAHLLKSKGGSVTLAIGDGANDVSMIQAAHIGVGISGREGRAAVQAADFAFGQFRFLVRLLLLHGRQSYLRCREVVLYAFYKNVAYVSCYIFYSSYSGFSAQTIFFPMYIATFNAIWAAYPTLGFGLFEQDVPARVALANPFLYDETRCQEDIDFYRAWVLWVLLGIWHGLMCFYIPVRALASFGAIGRTGHHTTVEYVGTAVMTAIVITVTLRVAIRTTHWTIINHALIWGTLALWLPFLAVLQGLCGSVPGLAPLCGLGPELIGSAGFWFGAVIGAPAASLLLDYTILVLQRHLAPRAGQILQEIEHRQQQQQRGRLTGFSGSGGYPGQQQQQQLPAMGPDVEQQYRQQQQQQVELAAAAGSRPQQQQQQQQQQPGGGIIAVAHVPSAAALGPSDLAGSSAGSGNQLLGSTAAAAAAGDLYEQWAPEYGGLGSEYNVGGPHTLGDIAASIEWAPNIITASPATLAASHTKRQLRAPLSNIRGGGLGPPMSAAAAAGFGGQQGSGEWGGFARTSSISGDGFGPAASPVAPRRPAAAAGASTSSSSGGIQMQQLPISISPQQQQQQQGLVAGVRAAAGTSRAQQRQQQGGSAGPQFTLGGDDTL